MSEYDYNIFMKTIFALASATGKAGVAVIRVSGSRSKQIFTALTGKPVPQPRLMQCTKILHPHIKDHIDTAMAVYFEQPKSFTGEDSVEFHIHGAPIIIQEMYEAIASVSNEVRMARPGEFTERAFMNGKLSVGEVEGLADLLAAETNGQRRQALWCLSGGPGCILDGWRRSLVDALAGVEAYIDFGEDENIESSVVFKANKTVEHVYDEIGRELDKRIGEAIRSGYRVAICGKPNAGKSSLYNVLAGKKAAIVSPIPGTTRDVLQVLVDLHGIPVILHDTAGVRDLPGDEVEQEGIDRAKEVIEHAHLVIHVIDATDPSPSLSIDPKKEVRVYNKSDLVGEQRNDGVHISCKPQANIDVLVQTIKDRLHADGGQAGVITRARHRYHLMKCHGHLRAYLHGADDFCLLAEQLRLACREIGKITGKVDVESILNSLFSSFCIGK